MSARSLIQFDNTKDLASWYDQKYTEMGGGWSMMRQTADEIREFIGVPSDKSKILLDVGCGQGHFISFMSEHFTVMGVDCSNVIIKKARESFPGLFFVNEDIERLSLSMLANIITSVGSVEHCINIDQALRRIYQILTDDGLFYALVPNELWIHMDQPQEQTHTDEEWLDIFTACGFKLKKQRRTKDLTEFLFSK